jgi:hypothetical protein
MLWRNYQRRWMKHMLALWKKLTSKTGTMHTAFFSVLQRLPDHFVRRNSQSFSRLTLRLDLLPHFWLIGARKTPKTRCYPFVPLCSSLSSRGSGPPVIQFAHFSVKEYLTSTRLAETKDIISRFHVSMTPAHTIVAQACLGVLLHLDENITRDSLKDFPLAKYAAEHWVDHARFENVSSKVQDGMKRLFDPSKSHLSNLGLDIRSKDYGMRR